MMKLIFKKDEKNQISVWQLVNGQEIDFSYIDMILCLLECGKLEPPDVGEDFSEAEKKSISSMIEYINSKASETIEAEDQGKQSE